MSSYATAIFCVKDFCVKDFSVTVGISSFIELSRNWRIVLDVGAELLPDDVTDSPIVDEDYVLSGFFALTYVF